MVRGHITVIVRSVSHDSLRFSLDVLILPRVTDSIPSRLIRTVPWPHLEGLTLADPDFCEPLPVDLLLGADIFPYIILGEKK